MSQPRRRRSGDRLLDDDEEAQLLSSRDSLYPPASQLQKLHQDAVDIEEEKRKSLVGASADEMLDVVQREAFERRAQTLTAYERQQLRAMVQDRGHEKLLQPRLSFCLADLRKRDGVEQREGGEANEAGSDVFANAAAAAAAAPTYEVGSMPANYNYYQGTTGAGTGPALPTTTTLDPNSQQLCLEWRNLTFTVGGPKGAKGSKAILKNCYGKLYPGEVCALIGPSGAGKSTLMNLLAGRQAWAGNGVSLEADIRFGGKSVTFEDLKSSIAYVMQQDALLGTQTVEETLYFAAKLKLPRGTTESQIEASVSHVMETLSLNHVKNVRIGDALTKGISGGQKKRVSAAIELLNKPSVLFLDEPTSGLDSFSSLELMQELKRIAESERAIICCTIHQPSSELFDQFDRLICMRDGEILFSGYNGKTATSILQQYGEQVLVQAGAAAGGGGGPSPGATTMPPAMSAANANNATFAVAAPGSSPAQLEQGLARRSRSGSADAVGGTKGVTPTTAPQSAQFGSSSNRTGSGPQSPSTSPHSVASQQSPFLGTVELQSPARGLANFPDFFPQLDGVGEETVEIPYAVIQQEEYNNEKMIPIFTVLGFLSLIASRPPPAGFNMADWLLHLAQSLAEEEIREVIEQTARSYEILNPGYVTPRVPLIEYLNDKTNNEYLVANVVSVDRRAAYSWGLGVNKQTGSGAGMPGGRRPLDETLFAHAEEDEDEDDESNDSAGIKQEPYPRPKNENFRPNSEIDKKIAQRDILLWPSLGVAPNALKRKFLQRTDDDNYLQEIPLTDKMELDRIELQGFCSQLGLLLKRELAHRVRDPYGLVFRFLIPTLQILFYSFSFLHLGRELVRGENPLGEAFFDNNEEKLDANTAEGKLRLKSLQGMFTAKIIEVYGAAGFVAWVVLASGASSLSLAVPQERAVFLREYHSNLYKVAAYMIAKLFTELGLIFVQTLFVMTLPYVSWQLPCLWTSWVAISMLLAISGSGFGVLLATANAKAPDRALMMAPLLLSTLPTCFSGSFRPVAEMPAWISWVAYLTPSTFGLKVMAFILTNDSVAEKIKAVTDAGHSENRNEANHLGFVTARDAWWKRMDISATGEAGEQGLATDWWFTWWFSTIVLATCCFLLYFFAILALAWNSRTLY
eukprot:g8144.t1